MLSSSQARSRFVRCLRKRVGAVFEGESEVEVDEGERSTR